VEETGEARGEGAPGGHGSGGGPGAPGLPGRRPNGIRRLYDWVLHWAATPYGLLALVILSFAESSFFPIPPDPLLMALCLAAPRRAFVIAAAATAASVGGGIMGYMIGAGAWHVMGDFFFAHVAGVTPEAFARVGALYDQYDFWAIFLAGLTPIPYKVFTLSSGVFSINFGIFVLASAMSRGLRFFLVAGLIYWFGPPIRRFIDRYFNLLTIAFGVLLVLGFVLVRYAL
jgi:membrane protein YqaA with SNARE-associated domain